MRLLTIIILWCILLVICWPLALVALVLFPVIWLLSIPFRILGALLEAMVGTVRALLLLPARLLTVPFQRRSAA